MHPNACPSPGHGIITGQQSVPFQGGDGGRHLSPAPVPRGSPTGWRARLTHAGRGPLPGAHQPPHGVVAGVAVLPVEAVPPSWRGDRGQPPRRAGGSRARDGGPQGPGHRGQPRVAVPLVAAGAEIGGTGAHLPGTAATADCLWTPSGSSCGHRQGAAPQREPGPAATLRCRPGRVAARAALAAPVAAGAARRRAVAPQPSGPRAAAAAARSSPGATGGAGAARGLTRPGCRRCR